MHQAMGNVWHFIQSVRIASRTLLISVALLAGTGFSVIGKSGWPFTQSKTYSMPVLVAWITPGTGIPCS